MFVPVMLAVAKWGGVVMGTKLAVDGAKKLTSGTKVEPVVSGVGDTFLTLLDPLDITGYRANKAAQEESEHQHEVNQALNEAQRAQKTLEDVQKGQAVRKKEAQKAIDAANKRANDAEKRTKQVAEQARKREQAAKTQQQAASARKAREKAEAANRMARMSQNAVIRAQQAKLNEAPDQAFQIAMLANQLASGATDPQMAINALNSAGTPEGRQLAASITDMVFRDDPSGQSFDPGAAMDQVLSDYNVPEDLDDVAGACCASCTMGASCGGKNRVTPDELIDGSINGAGEEDDVAGRDFFEFMYGDEVAPILAGPDTIASFDTEYESPFRNWDVQYGGE